MFLKVMKLLKDKSINYVHKSHAHQCTKYICPIFSDGGSDLFAAAEEVGPLGRAVIIS